MQKRTQQSICDSRPSNAYPDIISTPHLVNGSPRIAGRLISIQEVVYAASKHQSLQEVATDYDLTLSQLKQALGYCANQQCIKDKPYAYCNLCSLKRQQKGSLDVSDLQEVTFDKATYVRGATSLFLGTLTELLEDWNGQDWWVVAINLLIDYRDVILEK